MFTLTRFFFFFFNFFCLLLFALIDMSALPHLSLATYFSSSNHPRGQNLQVVERFVTGRCHHFLFSIPLSASVPQFLCLYFISISCSNLVGFPLESHLLLVIEMLLCKQQFSSSTCIQSVWSSLFNCSISGETLSFVFVPLL